MKLFIFGSTGDLVRRKVLPALQELNKPIEIYALGRKDYTSEGYIESVCSEGRCVHEFIEKIKYIKVDFNNKNMSELFLPYLDKSNVNLFYISLPPSELGDIFNELGNLKKKGYNLRILVEKPFGNDLSHAEKLHAIINKYGLDVLISDHYLFKRNILTLHKKDFSKLKIVALETLGLERRLTYYDSTGALKDMIQSHFLNIAFKLFDDLSDFKIVKYERKQYEGYTKELGKSSDTETFVHLILESKGKTFEFMTGKAFASKVNYVEIDGKKIDIDSYENPYLEMFRRFFNSDKKDFPDFGHTLLSWKIIDVVSKINPKLGHYEKGVIFQQV